MYAANYVIVIQYKREGYQIPVLLVLFSDSLTERKGKERKGKRGVPGKEGL